MATVTMIVLLMAAHARAQSADSVGRHQARQLLQQGIEREDAGDLEGALSRFEEAYRAYPSPKLFLNIGNVLRKLGREAEAARAYDRFLSGVASATELGEDKIQGARQALGELVRKVGRLVVRVTPSSATLSVDGKEFSAEPRLYVLPGAHQLKARAPGFLPKSISVEVGAGEEKPLDLMLDAMPAPPPALPVAADSKVSEGSRWLPWVIGGTGLALAITGAVLIVPLGGEYDNIGKMPCAQMATCDPSLWQAFETREKIGYALIGVGGAMAAAGIVWWIIDWRSAKSERHASIAPAPGGLLVAGTF